LGNWRIKRQVLEGDEIAYKFTPKYILRAGQTVTVGGSREGQVGGGWLLVDKQWASHGTQLGPCSETSCCCWEQAYASLTPWGLPAASVMCEVV
jgi:hypothetical protein